MYRLLYDQRTLFDPYGDDDEVVSDASLSMESNASSYLDFTISAKHPLYDVVAEREGVVRLYSDDALLFEGIIESIETDLELNKAIGCISALEYLNDSVVRPYSTVAGEEDLIAPSSVAGYFQWLIDQHNEHVLDTSKQFKIGVNQGSALKDSDYVYYSSSSYPTTASELTTNVIDAYGGYLFLRYENGLKVLDLYADVHDMNAQVVDFGVNITDFTKTVDTKDQCTALVVQGGPPTFVNGDFEDRTNNWEVFPGTEAATGVVHSGTYSSYFTEGYGEYVNSSFFYLKPGWRYKSIAWVKNERSSDVVIRAFYQTENGGSWVNYSCGGTDSLTVPNDGEWHELTVDFLPNGSENAKIRPRWIFDYVSNDGGRVYVDDFDFTRIDGEDSVAEDPIDLTLIPNGVSNIDEDVVKNGDAIYSTSYVARYGYKETTYNDDSLTTLDELMRQGVVQLRKIMAPTITLDVKAVDLALFMEGYEHLQVGQAVRVRSVPHDVDEYLMVSSIDLDLQNPGQTEYVFGASYDSLTGQQSGYLKSLNAGINASLDTVSSLDQTVKDQAVQIGSVEQIANDAKDTADNAQNTANSAQQAAQDAQNSASSALDKAEAVEGAVSEIQGMIDDINSGAEQAKQDAAQAKADAQQAAAKADAASQAAQAAANKADALEGSITDVTTTVNGVVQDIEEITTSVTGAISTANEALSAASSASQDLEGFKTTVSQTYQLKGDYATNTDLDEAIAEEVLNRNSAIEQSASSITSTVSQTYATKTDLAVTDGKAAQAQSAAQQAQTSASNAQSTANAANNTANGVADDLTDYMETVATTYASKSELEQTSESITATVEANYTEVKQLANTAQSTADSALSKANEASGELADFTESVTGDLADLQNQIDGNIATWFYAGTPTLTNEPAVNWTTTEEKNQHLGDLYYDTNNGYAWRFMVQNGSYSWGRITDSDVTKALEDAANAQDTADSKRRVFVSQPTPPYDVGDLWVQGENGDILRCATARASGSYNASDWVLASKYTDDSALEIFEGQVADIYSTKAELETATDSITATVEENFEKSVLVKEADGGVIDCGETAGMPLAGLTVYGQTRQNLWANPSGTSYGATSTANANGSLTVSGSFSGSASNAIRVRDIYNLKPSTEYTLSVDKILYPGTNDLSGFGILQRNSSGGWLNETYAGYGNVKEVTFTTSPDVASSECLIFLRVGETFTEGTYRVMLNEGSEAQPWCPPGLNSVNSVKVIQTGKNLYGGSDVTQRPYAFVAVYRWLNTNLVGKKVRMSFDLTTENGGRWLVYAYQGCGLGIDFGPNGTGSAYPIIANTQSGVTYHFSATGTVFYNPVSGFSPGEIIIYKNASESGNVHVSNIQIEFGEVETAYEPYVGTSTPIDLLGNKVSSLPDGTRDELTVDAGGNVVLRKRTNIFAGTTSTAWSTYDTECKWAALPSNHGVRDPYEAASKLMCDAYPTEDVNWESGSRTDYPSVAVSTNSSWYKKVMYCKGNGPEPNSKAFNVLYLRQDETDIPLGTVDLPALPEQNAHVWVSTGTQGLDPDIHATWYGENASALKNFASKAELKVESDQIKATVEETYSTKEEVSAVEDKANAAQDALDSYKETVSTTYATKSSVTQTANSIKQEVSETYTTKTEFEGLEVGGRNLLYDTKDMTVKKVAGNAQRCYTTYSNNVGTGGGLSRTADGIKLTFGADVNVSIQAPLASFGNVENGETVTLSFTYRGNITRFGDWYFLQRTLPNVSVWGFPGLNADGQWHEYKHTFSSPDANVRTCVSVLMFYNLPDYDKTKWVEIKEGTLKLEKGNKPTDWSPAPEDMLSTADASATYATKTSLSTVEQTVNGLKSTVSSNYTTLNNKFGSYYTKTEVDQKDNSIKSTVSSVQTTANNALEKASTVEQTADGLEVRLTQAEKDVDTAQSTANTAKTNAATAQSTANTANSTANTAKTNAATAQNTANAAQNAAEAAQSTANTAKTAAATAQTTATNAAKTATNYLKFDSSGLVVGNHTTTLTGNTQITSSGVNIRNGTSVLASFGADAIELGRNSDTSKLTLANGMATFGKVDYGAASEGLDIMVRPSSSSRYHSEIFMDEDGDYTKFHQYSATYKNQIGLSMIAGQNPMYEFSYAMNGVGRSGLCHAGRFAAAAKTFSYGYKGSVNGVNGCSPNNPYFYRFGPVVFTGGWCELSGSGDVIFATGLPGHPLPDQYGDDVFRIVGFFRQDSDAYVNWIGCDEWGNLKVHNCTSNFVYWVCYMSKDINVMELYQ